MLTEVEAAAVAEWINRLFGTSLTTGTVQEAEAAEADILITQQIANAVGST